MAQTILRHFLFFIFLTLSFVGLMRSGCSFLLYPENSLLPKHQTYQSGRICIDIKDEIPPSLPLQKGGIPLFGKEGLGEIFGRACLVNFGLPINSSGPTQSDRP